MNTVDGNGWEPSVASSLDGRLWRINPDSKTFILRANGARYQFAYQSDTEVIGAQADVAELVTLLGSHVIVHWDGHASSGQPVVTCIEPLDVRTTTMADGLVDPDGRLPQASDEAPPGLASRRGWGIRRHPEFSL